MSDLFDYLDCSGELYSYLGHFRQYRYLEQGHNDLDMGAAKRDAASAMDYASKPSGDFGGADFDEKYEQLRQNRKAIERSGGT